MLQTESGAFELRVVARVATNNEPKSVSVSPDGKLLAVCNFGKTDGDNVYLFDAQTLERKGAISFDGNAVESVFASDGKTLYVSNFNRHKVMELDLPSLSVRREISVHNNPKFMALSADGRFLFVASWSAKRLSVIDVERGEVVRTRRTGVHPRGIAVHPDGRVAVASFNDRLVQVFDEGADNELLRIRTCPFPRHLQIDPKRDRLFVTCTLGNISWYGLSDGYRRGFSRTGRNPRTLGLSRGGRWAATANFHSSDVSLADVELMRYRTSRVPDADRLVGLAIHPGKGLRVYVTSWGTAELIVLEPVEARSEEAESSASESRPVQAPAARSSAAPPSVAASSGGR